MRNHLNRFLHSALLLTLFFADTVLAQAGNLPVKAYIKGVPAHAQIYQLSCEARSAVDWAEYWGVRIREKKFLQQLPRSDNPNKGYVGSPSDTWGNIPPLSYGVHAVPVADLLADFGLNAQARYGMQWNDLQMEIARGRPVIVWVIGQMWPGIPRIVKISTGQKVRVASYEHTMIIIGYERNKIYAVDSYSGKIKSFSKKDFLQSWAVLGNMAITGQAKIQDQREDLTSKYRNNLFMPFIE